MTAIKGLDHILGQCIPWEDKRPTEKQLDWVREYLGEDELDRIIFQNLNRGQVKDIIKEYIRVSIAEKLYKYNGLSQGYRKDFSDTPCFYGNDNLFADTSSDGLYYDYNHQTGEWED